MPESPSFIIVLDDSMAPVGATPSYKAMTTQINVALLLHHDSKNRHWFGLSRQYRTDAVQYLLITKSWVVRTAVTLITRHR